MNEERQMILEMLRDGQITVEEAEKLLDSLVSAPAETNLTRSVKPKRLIVHATDGNGKDTVNVKVPFSLVKWGLKMGSKFASSEAGSYDSRNAMQYVEDIDFDEILAELANGEIELPYEIVEAKDSNNGDYVSIILE